MRNHVTNVLRQWGDVNIRCDKGELVTYVTYVKDFGLRRPLAYLEERFGVELRK